MKYDAPECDPKRDPDHDADQDTFHEHLDLEHLEDAVLRGDELDESTSVQLEDCAVCRGYYEQFVAECTLFNARRALATEPAPFLAPTLLEAHDAEAPRPILFRLMPIVVAVAACAAVFLLNVSSVPRITSVASTREVTSALPSSIAVLRADDDGILLSSATLECLDEANASAVLSSSSGRSACEAAMPAKPAPSLYAQRSVAPVDVNACAESSETRYACEELVTSSTATP